MPRIEYVFIGIIIVLGGWVLWLLERNGHVLIGIMIFIAAWVLGLWLGRWRVKPHRVALLATVIPPTLLVIAAVVLILLNPAFLEWKTEGGRNIADILALVGLYLVAAAILPSVAFAIMRKWEIAKGIGFGSGIGLVVWFIAFAALSS